MALTKINNNTLSAITGLPAGVGGKVLQIVNSKIAEAPFVSLRNLQKHFERR